MNTFKLVHTGIKLANEAQFLLEFYPELAKYSTIQKLVNLGQQWNQDFSAMIAEDKEVQS